MGGSCSQEELSQLAHEVKRKIFGNVYLLLQNNLDICITELVRKHHIGCVKNIARALSNFEQATYSETEYSFCIARPYPSKLKCFPAVDPIKHRKKLVRGL